VSTDIEDGYDRFSREPSKFSSLVTGSDMRPPEAQFERDLVRSTWSDEIVHFCGQTCSC
jgi:hypothetical protein